MVDRIRRSKRPGTSGFVPSAKRVTTFDNDGTLWFEQPLYAQFVFAIDRLKDMPRSDASFTERQLFKAAIEGDMRMLMADGERPLSEIIGVLHAGMSW
ncbi:hypothetical protein [Neoroseomonas lacus]|uniref:Haloacid dehalogenase n=1 Tax=Neoroseomonas lacus TaxID=287609 RepID=A0A917NZF5_9PROT|nr:hypothetical protein [Neoroseomonas lacus]GGJ43455.1 hypothetical protein GCM10011320_58690 [Neoroseomonas lacus]